MVVHTILHFRRSAMQPKMQWRRAPSGPLKHVSNEQNPLTRMQRPEGPGTHTIPMPKLNSAEDVFAFWFGVEPSLEKRRKCLSSFSYFESRVPTWFLGKNKEFELVQLESVDLVHRAGRGELHGGEWDQPLGLLARILLTDQFPRCIWRGRAEAFQYDNVARGICRAILEKGWDKSEFFFAERIFIYLPLEHSESLADQRECVRLMRTAAAGSPWLTRWKHARSVNVKIAEDHLRVIERFGRFPYRNESLGRASSPDEIAWLRSGNLPVFAKSQLASSQHNGAASTEPASAGGNASTERAFGRVPRSPWTALSAAVLAIGTAAAISYRIYQRRHEV